MLAALLGRFGIRTIVAEADAGYCTGSRAICISRRSQEILGWIGVDRAVVETGLSWTGGRSYFRDTEVLHFRMPSDPAQRFAPMVNLQQFHVEALAHRAAEATGFVDVRWSTRVSAVRPLDDGVEATLDGPGGERTTVRAAWLVACDGGRSTVREQLGLQLEGIQYDGRYVIVDIEQDTQRPVERLAWFDPPSNRGSTILMHRQPGNVWRIDYQIADDEDPVEAVRPEVVLPRVRSHLEMIGETAPWKPLWISIYNAKCLTLARYRHGRVVFAGDAAHLVPIFGVRGLNSGLDDAGNLAWKLALVLRSGADASLVDSYSQERVQAARENIAYGAKSTEFMAPPHHGFRLMREAALRLATQDDTVRSLVNPRQSLPVAYRGSALDAAPVDDAPANRGPVAGEPAPEALLADGHLTQRFGRCSVVLAFGDGDASHDGLDALAANGLAGPAAVEVLRMTRAIDLHGAARRAYAAEDGTVVVVRPDGYILGRWPTTDAARVRDALGRLR